jgi:hypothetical protein
MVLIFKLYFLTKLNRTKVIYVKRYVVHGPAWAAHQVLPRWDGIEMLITIITKSSPFRMCTACFCVIHFSFIFGFQVVSSHVLCFSVQHFVCIYCFTLCIPVPFLCLSWFVIEWYTQTVKLSFLCNSLFPSIPRISLVQIAENSFIVKLHVIIFNT